MTTQTRGSVERSAHPHRRSLVGCQEGAIRAIALVLLIVPVASLPAHARALRRGVVLFSGHQAPGLDPNDVEESNNPAHLGDLAVGSVRVFLNWGKIQGARCTNVAKFCRNDSECGAAPAKCCTQTSLPDCPLSLMRPSSEADSRTRLHSFPDWPQIKEALRVAKCGIDGSDNPREVIVTVDGYPDWAGAVQTPPSGDTLCGNQECKIERQLPSDRDMASPWAWLLQFAMQVLAKDDPECGESPLLAFEIINEPNQIAWISDGSGGVRRSGRREIVAATARMIATAVRLAAKKYPTNDPMLPDPHPTRFHGVIYAPGTAGQTENGNAVGFTRKVMKQLACELPGTRLLLRTKLRWSHHNYEDVEGGLAGQNERRGRNVAERVLDELACKTFRCPGGHSRLQLSGDKKQFLYLTEGGAHVASAADSNANATHQCAAVKHNFDRMRSAKPDHHACSDKEKGTGRIRLWSNYRLYDTCDTKRTGMFGCMPAEASACGCVSDGQRPIYEWFKQANAGADCP